MLVSIEGEESCGKTTLAYTAPLKIVGFAFDMGVERALFGGKHQDLFSDTVIKVIPYDATVPSVPSEPFPWAENDIAVFELPQPIQLDTVMITGAEVLWNFFIGHLVAALKDPDVHSIVVDTMTVARRVKADAYLEGLQANTEAGHKPRERLLQIEWGGTNDAIRGIYTTAAGLKKNLIAVHHLTDERKEMVAKDGSIQNMVTGNRILEGLNQTYRFVDIAIRNEKMPPSKEDGIVKTTFQKCGYNLTMEGFPVTDPTWNKISQVIEDTLGGSLKLERANG